MPISALPLRLSDATAFASPFLMRGAFQCRNLAFLDDRVLLRAAGVGPRRHQHIPRLAQSNCANLA